jgi:hypothetical protein
MVAITITNATAPVIPIAVSTLLETPIKGQNSKELGQYYIVYKNSSDYNKYKFHVLS